MTAVRIAAACIFAATLLFLPPDTTAQTASSQRQVSNATELDPEDPRAKRASALVTLLVSKDSAAAQKFLKTHALPEGPAATDIQKRVADLQATLAAGFAIDRLLEGPEDDVVVMLNSTAGGRGGRMALIVQVEKKAPHRIRDVKPFEGRRVQGGV